jgi:hypothetical protein
MKRVLSALLLAVALAAPAAQAAEVIATGVGGAPPPAAEPPPAVGDQPGEAARAQAIGDWAQRVMAGEPAPEDQPPARSGRCVRVEDRQPHGQVWAGIGTHGYRNVGGVVTQPVGDCGRVTIAIDHTESNGRWRRR